jgi:predicted SprT family Zn-dependent metalloprotease
VSSKRDLNRHLLLKHGIDAKANPASVPGAAGASNTPGAPPVAPPAKKPNPLSIVPVGSGAVLLPGGLTASQAAGGSTGANHVAAAVAAAMNIPIGQKNPVMPQLANVGTAQGLQAALAAANAASMTNAQLVNTAAIAANAAASAGSATGPTGPVYNSLRATAASPPPMSSASTTGSVAPLLSSMSTTIVPVAAAAAAAVAAAAAAAAASNASGTQAPGLSLLSSSSNSNELSKDPVHDAALTALLAQQARQSTNKKKPYECSTCGKEYAHLGSLYRHANVHNGKWECGICGVKTGSKHDLARHTQKHSTVKPFICTVCERGFTRARALTAHKVGIFLFAFQLLSSPSPHFMLFGCPYSFIVF